MTVVAATDAVVDPRAVVVEGVDAGVAVGTMGAAWWSVELTRDAPLHADLSPVDLNSLVEWSSEVVVSIFVRRSCFRASVMCLTHTQAAGHSPLGMTPGSMKVARVKLETTKVVMMT